MMRFFTWLRKFGTYYRTNGLLWLCRHIITNLVHYNKLVIFETDVHEPSEFVKAKIPVNVRTLSRSEEDIDRLTKFWPMDTYVPKSSTRQMIRNLIIERLAVGEECFIVEYNGEVIGMSWYGFYNAHVFEPYEKKRGLVPGEALAHSVFFAENFRGKNVANAVYFEKWNFLVKNYYKKLISYVDTHNDAAMKVSKRYGGRPVQTLRHLKLFGISIFFLTKRSG